MSAAGAGRLPSDWGKYYPSWGCSQNTGYWYGSSLCGVYPWFTRIPCSWHDTREACMECCESRAKESMPFIQGYYDQQGVKWMCGQSCWNKPSMKDSSGGAVQQTNRFPGSLQNPTFTPPYSGSSSQMNQSSGCSSCGQNQSGFGGPPQSIRNRASPLSQNGSYY